MIWRLLAFVAAALLVQGGAQAADASFHCVVKSAYFVDRADQPVPDTFWHWERTKINVLIHNEKALVTHQLFGMVNPVTDEFLIVQTGGAENSWILELRKQGLARVVFVVMHIHTWGLKDLTDPIRFTVDYYPDVMLGTCERIAGEVGFEKQK